MPDTPALQRAVGETMMSVPADMAVATTAESHSIRMTALVCTRNRGSAVADAVRSILANDHPDFELIVIDQSSNDRSEVSLRSMCADPRLRYLRSPTSGLSNARNVGMSHARALTVAMTDDDCTVPPDWLTRMEKVFTDNPQIAMLLGNVVAADYDKTKGFVPSYSQCATIVARSMRDKHLVEGMAACMGMRVDAWSALSGFDPMLGAGSPFRSADETDMVIRFLLARRSVLETPDVEVTHQGLRAWSAADAVVFNYLFGIGATIAKHIKSGNWSVGYVVLALAGRWMFKRPAMDYGFKPGRRVRLAGFLRGFKAGCMTPVDTRTGHFVRANSSVPATTVLSTDRRVS